MHVDLQYAATRVEHIHKAYTGNLALTPRPKHRSHRDDIRGAGFQSDCQFLLVRSQDKLLALVTVHDKVLGSAARLGKGVNVSWGDQGLQQGWGGVMGVEGALLATPGGALDIEDTHHTIHWIHVPHLHNSIAPDYAADIPYKWGTLPVTAGSIKTTVYELELLSLCLIFVVLLKYQAALLGLGTDLGNTWQTNKT